MRTIRPNTQCGRLLRVLADGRWHGGPQEFGNDFHRAAARIYDLAELGFPTQSRRRKGRSWFEYKLLDGATWKKAAELVWSWDVDKYGLKLEVPQGAAHGA